MNDSKTDRILKAAIVVLLGVFAFVIANTLREKVVVVGDAAPDFAITTDDGKTVSTANFGGRLLVLNFWATWCPPCIEEWPSLNHLAAEMKNAGVVVLAISVDKDPKAYQNFLARFKPTLLTARDPAAKINADFGTFKYPETYVIDAKGKVVRKYISSQPWDDPNMIGDIKSLL